MLMKEDLEAFFLESQLAFAKINGKGDASHVQGLCSLHCSSLIDEKDLMEATHVQMGRDGIFMVEGKGQTISYFCALVGVKVHTHHGVAHKRLDIFFLVNGEGGYCSVHQFRSCSVMCFPCARVEMACVEGPSL